MPAPPFDTILGSTRPRFRGWRIDASQMSLLSVHPRASEWTSLEFMGARFGDEGLAPLLGLPALTELSLNDCGITAEGVSRLGVLGSRLSWLNLSSNGLGPDAMTALAGLSLPALTTSLELSENPLGDAGAVALARLGASPEELDLALTGLGPKGLAALVRSPLFLNLRHLRLTGNPLGDEGARELAGWGMSRLPLGLDIAWTGIGEAGLRALHETEVLARCTRLDLRGLQLSESCLLWLADLGLPRLSMLKVESASLTAREALEASYQRVIVNTLEPRWVYGCPYCRLQTSVHDPVCARCGGDTSRDSGFETTPADIERLATVPCHHCLSLVAEAAMRCAACRSWVPSQRELAQASSVTAAPSSPGPAESVSPPSGPSKAMPLGLAAGCGCLLVSGCVLSVLLSALGS